MLVKDDGIVLRTSRSGETSLIVLFLGRHAGKVRLIAKGALSAKSRWRGVLEPGVHVEMMYYQREHRTLYFAREATMLSRPAPGDSLEHFAMRLAAVELLDAVCYSGAAEAGAVDVAIEYLDAPVAADPLFLFLAFEIRLLEVLGALPDLSACSVCGGPLAGGRYDPREGTGGCSRHLPAGAHLLPVVEGLGAAVELCVSTPLAELAGARVDAVVRKELGRLLHWTYTAHVQGYSPPASLNLV